MNWLLAVASGALLFLLFPPYDFAWFAPFALTPLLIACARESNWRRRAALGYVCGIVQWFGMCYWIQWTTGRYAGVGPVAAWALFLLICLVKALQAAVFATLAGWLIRTVWAVPATAALWVALEWTHAWTGLSWLPLGNAASGMSVPLRIAPIAGVWGVSFVFALLATGIACVVLRRPRSHCAWLLSIPGLLLLPELPGPVPGSATAVLSQPNESETNVWNEELVTRSLRRKLLLSLGEALKKPTPELIVWPEDPGPFYGYDETYTGALTGLARTSGAYIIAGAVDRTPGGAPLNAALTVSPRGSVLARYNKIHLVPFGEFVPWPFQQITKQVSTEAGDFEAGRSVVVTPIGAHRIGTFICYEAAFPGFVRQFAKGGAEVLVTISNDGWFGKSAARYQHLRIARMRAVENRRWLLRSTNDGVTVAIDPAGRVTQAAPEYVETATRMNYGYVREQTFYTRHGDWFVLLCALMAGAALLKRYFHLRQNFLNQTLSAGRD